MFWIVFALFVIDSVLITIVILMQEPKQSGLGDALGGGGGGGDFGTMGGTAGGLHRLTIWLGVTWGLLALALQVVPRA
ncbi:MAG TPA: preprotein translocase subunit SecG [Trueperaceae bacterium]|nr:preprotein translocase subunit SecG [Trueperaceae bacterium]